MLKTLRNQLTSRNLAIIIILLMAIYLAVSYTSATGPLTRKDIFKMSEDNIRKTNPQLLDELSQEDHSRAFESVDALTLKKYNRVQIKSDPEITSPKDLNDYKNQRLELIDKLSKTKKEDTKIETIINFKKLLTRDEYLDFVKKYNDDIELINIHFRSTHNENGVTDVSNEYPLPSDETTEFEEKLMEDMGFKGYKFLTGIQTLTANIKSKDLKKIQNDPRIYLVDVGPVDIKEQYENGKTVDMMWRYIFPEMERYGSE